ncbi:MAG: heavy metal translocating P-type ATPase [Sediminispirochaetaceae bacterium]
MSSQELHHSFSVEGMTCASCSRIVERSLNKVEGVKFVSVNLATHKAYVVADESVSVGDIEQTVESSGYSYRKEVPGNDILKEQFSAARRNIFLALAVTLPLMALMLLHMLGIHVPYFTLIEVLAAGFVLFFPGRSTIASAFTALRHGHTNMNTLISVSAFVSWFTAVLSAAGIQQISFGTIAAMILTFHLGGRYIEARLKHRAAQDVKSLLEIQASSARILVNGNIEELPVEAVKPGAVVLVRTGEKIPLDGRIIEGSASIDESMVTGEPIPVHRAESEQVIGGTIVQQGSLRIEVEKVGEDTFLAQMIRLVDEAQSARVPLQALADRISFYFVPIILVIAFLSGFGWYLLYSELQPLLRWASGFLFWIQADPGPLAAGLFVFVTILVIACPCALGLATPIALVAGSGKAARNGILIKNGEALQHSRSLRYMLMDKTGTLTRGKPRVEATSLSHEDLLPVAAVESHSVHPLAAAIVDYVNETAGETGPAVNPEVKVSDLEETSGEGISGRVDGHLYRIGKPADPSRYAEHMEKGHTVVEIERDSIAFGWLAIADPVKPDAAEAIADLKKMGIIAVMVTGDAETTARAVADQVGIHEVMAGISPDRKAEIVRHYRRKGDPVGMVGDGINDAAALKTADVGFAIGTGTDLSIESADIVLIRDSLSTLTSAVSVSRQTVTAIKQNLFWAFFYNLIALPLAVMGFLHPIIAELAMLFSSINVILNSLKINLGGNKNETAVQRT